MPKEVIPPKIQNETKITSQKKLSDLSPKERALVSEKKGDLYLESNTIIF